MSDQDDAAAPGAGETTPRADHEPGTEQPGDAAPSSGEDAPAPQRPTPADSARERFLYELRQAREHFAGINVGATQEHTTPLSRQMQKDIARLFPIDEKYFVEGRKTQLAAVWGYALLRALTFVLFAIMTTLQVAVFVGLHENATGPLSGMGASLSWAIADQSWGPLATIAGLAAVFWILRWGLRARAFEVLRIRAERLSFNVFGRLDDIKARITETAANTRDRAGVENWPARARDWTIIALWCAKRAEYLDRYITIVIWTVRTRITDMERGLLALKLVFVSALIWMAATSLPDRSAQALLGVAALAVFLAAQTYILWHRAGMKPTDFWTSEFRKHAPSEEGSYETYVDKVSGIVRNLVDEVIAKEWGQGGGKKP